MSKSPINSLDSPGSIADPVLLTVARSSDRFVFHTAAFDPLAAFANPHAKTFDTRDDAKRSVLDFIVNDKEGSQMSDESLLTIEDEDDLKNFLVPRGRYHISVYPNVSARVLAHDQHERQEIWFRAFGGPKLINQYPDLAITRISNLGLGNVVR